MSSGAEGRGGPCARDGRNLKVDSAPGSLEIEGGETFSNYI